MPIKVYGATALTGAGTGALDKTDGNLLNDEDYAYVRYNGKVFHYILDADHGGSADGFFVISPATNPGDKRWVFVSEVFIQSGTSASTRSSLDKTREVFSVTDFPTFAAAHDALYTAGGGRLVIPNGTTVSISDDETVESIIELEIHKGGLLSIASGKVLTIDGTLTCGRYQVFTGSGTVEFSSLIHNIHPEWWGPFPNGSDDTAILNKAIAAAQIVGAPSEYMGDANIIIGPGKYYIEPDGLDDIKTNFLAPDAYFYPTEETDADATILPFNFPLYPRKKVQIGGIIGLTAYNANPATHYHTGIEVKQGDSAIWDIQWIVSMKIGILMNGQAYNSHLGVHKFNIWTLIGCTTGIYCRGGDESEGNKGLEACEANEFNIEYQTYCQYSIITQSQTGDALVYNNRFKIGVLELNGLPSYTVYGFMVDGPLTLCNTFEVNGGLVPPGSGSFIVVTDTGASDNIFKLCQIDWSLVYQDSDAGYNIFDLAGRTNWQYPGLATNLYGRSIIAYTAAPSTGLWRQGDICWNSAPTAEGTLGWVCVSSGNPGTWKVFGSIAA